MADILVADDEPKLGELVSKMLSISGHRVTHVAGGAEALELLSQQRFEVIVTDLRMPGADGLEVLTAAKKLTPAPEVILMTAYGTAESAVEAMKAGAADYLTKPFPMDELRIRVSRLLERKSAEAKSQRLLERLAGEFVAVSKPMQVVLSEAERVATTDASVLLLGESGTGKSYLARYIHYTSHRSGARLVEVHCASLPETLLESELFGHEKGAFTGAMSKKEGQLAAADQGTVFLDEIGEIAQATQVKLLRFLQEHEILPVGSIHPQDVNARIIAATNRDLPRAVQDGTFREDLYYRLNVFSIHVPPLRQRKEDILPLAHRFLEGRGLPSTKLSEEANNQLLRHEWPGNVRELENALERAIILAGDGLIEPIHLGSAAPGENLSRRVDSGDLLSESFNLDSFERDLIYEAIKRAGGNKAQAARLLGITRRRLYSRLKSLNERISDDGGIEGE